MPRKLPSLAALGSLAAVLLAASPTLAAPPDEEARVTVDALVLDKDGNPVRGLDRGDFEVSIGERVRPVSDATMVAADVAPRRFVFVFNRRGADAVQLNRALRGLRSFIEDRMLDSDESLFVDMGETLQIGRAFGPGKAVALAGVGTIPAMGYRSPAGAEDDAPVAARMLELVADRLATSAGRKIVVLYSESLSSFTRPPEQPGTVRNSATARILPLARGASDAGLGSIIERLRAASATVHVLHLAGVQDLEERILTADRGELIVDGSGRSRRDMFSSTTYEARQRDASPRSGDDILSSFAAETGGLHLARPTRFRKVLDRIDDRNRFTYRLALVRLVGEGGAGERESQLLQVRVPGCSGCTVLAARGSVPE